MPNTQTVVTVAPVTAPILVECHGCGELFAARKLFDHKDNLFCEECMQEKGFTQCSDCEHMVNEDNTYTTAAGDTICDTCLNDDYFSCDRCESIYHATDGVSIGDYTTICQRCYENHYFRCDGCENIYHNDDMYSTDDGCYCESCHTENERVCDSCHESCGGSLTHVRGIGDVCSSCRPTHPINCYSFKPSPNFFPICETPGEHKFYLGIEIEISCKNTCDSINTFDEQDMERIYLKDDASVPEGFEIVSHPMTMEEHRIFDWENLCKKLAQSGAQGNKYNHGIHVHISKTYLSELHRLKLSWFMCQHLEEIKKLSRRDRCYHEGRSTAIIIESIKQDKKYKNEGRCEILNWEPNNTVEFRLPLSTLRYETLLATLEFCDAAVKFVQTDVNFITLQDCWEQFMVWCNDNGYKCLVGYFLFYTPRGYNEI